MKLYSGTPFRPSVSELQQQFGTLDQNPPLNPALRAHRSE